jgi:hypothetical protein
MLFSESQFIAEFCLLCSQVFTLFELIQINIPTSLKNSGFHRIRQNHRTCAPARQAGNGAVVPTSGSGWRLPGFFEVTIGSEERRGLFDELCADTACCTGVGCIALNARQHVFRFNPVFQAGFPGFESPGLGIATSAFGVGLPGCFEFR